VTHLILFSIEVKPNGNFAALDRFPSKASLADAIEAAAATGKYSTLNCISDCRNEAVNLLWWKFANEWISANGCYEGNSKKVYR
jgi:hypothetical protein